MQCNILIMLRNTLIMPRNILIMSRNILNMPCNSLIVLCNILIMLPNILNMLPNILIMQCNISMLHNILIIPPLLVQRCNGTTAGLGHLEVVGMPMHKFLLRQWICDRTFML